MKKYLCPHGCGKSFDRQSYLDAHLSKTKSCVFYKHVKDGEYYKCMHCDKQYKHSQSLSRHLNKCKILKEKQKNEPLNSLNEPVITHYGNVDNSTNTTNNVNCHNTNNNQTINKIINNSINIQTPIFLQPFGRENFQSLTKEEIIDAIQHQKGLDVYGQILTKVHFNPLRPQNHNIFMKGDDIVIYNGFLWRKVDDNMVFEQLADRITEKTKPVMDKLKKFCYGYTNISKLVGDSENGNYTRTNDYFREVCKQKSMYGKKAKQILDRNNTNTMNMYNKTLQ